MPNIQQLLDLRFPAPKFKVQNHTLRPPVEDPVSTIYRDKLQDAGFIFSHDIVVENGIGKEPHTDVRLAVYLNTEHNTYAILTNLYHLESWVYFTSYYADGRRLITASEPGALQLDATIARATDFYVQSASSANLASQLKTHLKLTSTHRPHEAAVQMDANQHTIAERNAYTSYVELLLDSTVLRQTDTQLLGFTHTGVRSFHLATSSSSVKRPKPKVAAIIGKRGNIPGLNYRDAALVASAAVFAVLLFNVISNSSLKLDSFETTSSNSNNANQPIPVESVAAPSPEDNQVDEAINDEAYANATLEALPLATNPTDSNKVIGPQADSKVTAESDPMIDLAASRSAGTLAAAAKKSADKDNPEQFIIASEEDEMWRIAVENAEFYLMSSDGDPAPWIRTARKMATGFGVDDPRLARTFFLAALLEPDPLVAEQQYNRALDIQTQSVGLYHTETAQTLEALAWIAEDSKDDLDEAITHQRLALNVYRGIFGEEAEDTRSARWKLQYFEDRLAGRRPKSDDNRRLLPALARFAK